MHKSKNYYTVCFVAPEAFGVFSDIEGGPVGGAEIQQMLIARALVKAGHDVNVIVKDEFYQDKYQWCGINIHPCKFRYLQGSNFYYFPDTVRLINLLRKINADFNLLKTPVSTLFAMSLHRRLFGGKLIKFMASDKDCSHIGNGLISHLYPIGTKALDYTIFQSRCQMAEGGKNLGLQGSVIKSIAHGQISRTDTNKDIDVLWVGAFDENKQPDVLLKLVEEMPELQFCMISKNGGEVAKFRTAMENLSNLDSFTNLPFNSISDYYKRAKLLLCTSLYEGFPNTFLQAWQHGVPVISLNVNPDNVITDNGIGLVSGSFEKMIDDIRLLLADDELRKSMGNNAIAYMNANHSEKVIVQQFQEIFQKLMK